jgi:hypothetical protein
MRSFLNKNININKSKNIKNKNNKNKNKKNNNIIDNTEIKGSKAYKYEHIYSIYLRAFFDFFFNSSELSGYL